MLTSIYLSWLKDDFLLLKYEYIVGEKEFIFQENLVSRIEMFENCFQTTALSALIDQLRVRT